MARHDVYKKVLKGLDFWMGHSYMRFIGTLRHPEIGGAFLSCSNIKKAGICYCNSCFFPVK